MDKIKVTKWKDEYIGGAKRCNLNYSDWLSDWFVGTGKDESCYMEGTWWDMICLARNILASENTKHAYKYGLEKIYKGIWNCHYGKKSHKRKKVCQYTLDNKLLKIWDCAEDVNKKLGINIGNIASCCRGERNKAGGYKWKYEERKDKTNE